MIDAVLFDVGNTLLRCQAASPTAALELGMRPVYDRLVELDFKLPAFESYWRVIRRRLRWAYLWSRIVRREVPLLKGLQQVHKRLGVNLSAEQTCVLCRKAVSAVGDVFTVIDDAKEVVKELHQAGLKLGLVSNTILPGFTVDEFLKNEGLLDYFTVRIYSSDVRYMKPNPKIFRLALDQLEVSAEKTMFVGDRVNKDIAGAARLGMKTVLFVTGEKFPSDWDCADHTIRRLTELPAIVGDRGM